MSSNCDYEAGQNFFTILNCMFHKVGFFLLKINFITFFVFNVLKNLLVRLSLLLDGCYVWLIIGQG